MNFLNILDTKPNNGEIILIVADDIREMHLIEIKYRSRGKNVHPFHYWLPMPKDPR